MARQCLDPVEGGSHHGVFLETRNASLPGSWAAVKARSLNRSGVARGITAMAPIMTGSSTDPDRAGFGGMTLTFMPGTKSKLQRTIGLAESNRMQPGRDAASGRPPRAEPVREKAGEFGSVPGCTNRVPWPGAAKGSHTARRPASASTNRWEAAGADPERCRSRYTSPDTNILASKVIQ